MMRSKALRFSSNIVRRLSRVAGYSSARAAWSFLVNDSAWHHLCDTAGRIVSPTMLRRFINRPSGLISGR